LVFSSISRLHHTTKTAFWGSFCSILKTSRNLLILGLAHNAKHLGAALWTRASHRSSFYSALAFHSNLFSVRYFSFGFTFNTVTFHNEIFLL